ncbi:DDE-type integrase/transposase/recombinase [Belnapia moabensis]|uniref:DDE-type integrase/transposase/recombinase n=1 Tax=Belnapia moabensis TaxID=365533 RepID=UPI0038CDB256
MAPNLLGRDFTASAPDRVWLADLTYIWTAEGWLYLAVVLDLFSRRVVGWAMTDHLGHELALAALDMAIAHEKPAPGLVHHSDRGVQPGLNSSSQHLFAPIAPPHQELRLVSSSRASCAVSR